MPYSTVVFTSAANSSNPGAGTAVNLNWIGGKPTTVSLSFGTSTSSDFAQIQYTLDDIQRVPSSLVLWIPVASSAASSTIAIYAASAAFDTGVTLAFLNPLAAVRMFSSALNGGSMTMKVIQGEGW